MCILAHSFPCVEFGREHQQGWCKVSLRPAGAGEKETGGRPQAPAKGRQPLRTPLFPDLATQNYFEISRRADGHQESFTHDFILLKGRKS